MSSDQWQLWLAVYGAVVATTVAGWQVWTTVRDRPDLRVSASAPSRVFKPRASGRGVVGFSISYPIAIMNSGDRPITIMSGDLEYTIRPMIPSDFGLASEDDRTQRLPAELLPLKLDAGEAKHVALVLKLEAAANQGFQRGYTGEFRFAFETTRGTLRRTAEFVLDASTLNSRIPD